MNDNDNKSTSWIDTSPKSDITKSTIQNLIDLLRKLKVSESVLDMIKKDLAFPEVDPIMKELQELQHHINNKVAIKTITKFQ